MHAYRTHNCGALRAADTGKDVRLSGWVHRKRDHGGLIFIDLRDHHGLTQLVLAPGSAGFATAEHLRAESVIRIDGEVVARTAETVNPNLPTGEVEVKVKAVEVLSEAAELPVPVFGEPDYPEDLRLADECAALDAAYKIAVRAQDGYDVCARSSAELVIQTAGGEKRCLVRDVRRLTPRETAALATAAHR